MQIINIWMFPSRSRKFDGIQLIEILELIFWLFTNLQINFLCKNALF